MINLQFIGTFTILQEISPYIKYNIKPDASTRVIVNSKFFIVDISMYIF